MYITKRSEATGVEHTRDIDITEYQYHEYTMGRLGYVQEAFPELSADDREFLVTGVTAEEWDELFGDIEEDEDSDYTDYGYAADDVVNVEEFYG